MLLPIRRPLLYRMIEPCPHCGADWGLIYKRGPHFRMDCQSCQRYIKFVSKAEVQRRDPDLFRKAEADADA